MGDRRTECKGEDMGLGGGRVQFFDSGYCDYSC